MRAPHLLHAAFVLATASTLFLATSSGAQSTSRTDDLLSAKEARVLAAAATTPADHLRLERHFNALAEKLTDDAREHRAAAAAYRKAQRAAETKRPGAPDTAVHCDRLAEYTKKAATEARTLAKAHAAHAAAGG